MSTRRCRSAGHICSRPCLTIQQPRAYWECPDLAPFRVTMQRVPSVPLRITLRSHASITSRSTRGCQTLSADRVRRRLADLHRDECARAACPQRLVKPVAKCILWAGQTAGRLRSVLVTMKRVSSVSGRVWLRRHASITLRSWPGCQTHLADRVRLGSVACVAGGQTDAANATAGNGLGPARQPKLGGGREVALDCDTAADVWAGSRPGFTQPAGPTST